MCGVQGWKNGMGGEVLGVLRGKVIELEEFYTSDM